MGLPWELTKHLIWNTTRGIFLLFRSIIWLINGTYTQINHNYKKDSYEKTVQVLTVVARHKLDYVLQPSGANNFIAVHHRFEDPDYVLSDNISLYYVNKNEAVFVEADKGIDVTCSDYGAFVRIAQFKKARKLLIVPLHVFHKLGEKVGKTDAKLIFLHNTSRCGSTLVTQVFEETGSAIAYSEPDALNALTQLQGVLSDEDLDTTVISAMNLLCKPLKDRDIKAYILKPTQPTIAATPDLVRLFPQSYHMFLYRDGLKVAQSLARASRGMPLLGLLLVIGRTSPMLTKKMVVEIGLPSKQFERKVLSGIHFCSIVWAAGMRNYLDFREKGIDMVGIRYEDMVEDPNFSFQKIFGHCGLPFDGKAVEKAFGRDSQRDSPLSMENLNKFKVDEFTPEIKKQTDGVCDSFGLPYFPDPYITPGTITQK